MPIIVKRNEHEIKVGPVDDHLLFLKGFSTMLQTLQDFEVMVHAVNGLDLQHKLENKRDLPDLLIVDMDMPEMDGLGLVLEALRKEVVLPKG